MPLSKNARCSCGPTGSLQSGRLSPDIDRPPAHHSGRKRGLYYTVPGGAEHAPGWHASRWRSLPAAFSLVTRFSADTKPALRVAAEMIVSRFSYTGRFYDRRSTCSARRAPTEASRNSYARSTMSSSGRHAVREHPAPAGWQITLKAGAAAAPSTPASEKRGFSGI